MAGYNLSDSVFSSGKSEQSQIISNQTFSSIILSTYIIISSTQFQKKRAAIKNTFKFSFI